MDTEKVIEYKLLKSSSDPLAVQVEKTYTGSFPASERRELPAFRELMDSEPMFSVYALLHHSAYIGFITTWQFSRFAYIEHFAIDEAARNGGFGGVAMKQFLKQTPLPIVLEVELPRDELSRRRIGFYERLGFTLDSHPYEQPPYRKSGQVVPMQLMSYGNISLDETFEEVRRNLYHYVYGA